jgi:hypothetical protein
VDKKWRSGTVRAIKGTIFGLHFFKKWNTGLHFRTWVWGDLEWWHDKREHRVFYYTIHDVKKYLMVLCASFLVSLFFPSTPSHICLYR